MCTNWVSVAWILLFLSKNYVMVLVMFIRLLIFFSLHSVVVLRRRCAFVFLCVTKVHSIVEYLGHVYCVYSSEQRALTHTLRIHFYISMTVVCCLSIPFFNFNSVFILFSFFSFSQRCCCCFVSFLVRVTRIYMGELCIKR